MNIKRYKIKSNYKRLLIHPYMLTISFVRIIFLAYILFLIFCSTVTAENKIAWRGMIVAPSSQSFPLILPDEL